MSIRRIHTRPEEIEPLRLFSQLDIGAELGLAASERAASFMNRIRRGLDDSLASPSRLHGWRVQSMFASTVLALGDFTLLKLEDAGECYAAEHEGRVKLPDFRLVTSEGEQLLTEVKNVAPRNGMLDRRIRRTEFERLTRYATLTGARLTFAHYWSALNTWTLVDANTLAPEGERMRLELQDAVMADELVTLGDRILATTPPLVLSLIADTRAPRSRIPANGGEEVRFTVAAVELSCAGQAITDHREREIAMALMMYGSWPQEWAIRANDGRPLTGLDLVARPIPEEQEQAEKQGFATIGRLSSLYSTIYNAATLGEDGEVEHLGHTVTPGLMGGLIPENYWSRSEHALPLWVFEAHPASAAGVL
jgi:hypothetical protein